MTSPRESPKTSEDPSPTPENPNEDVRRLTERVNVASGLALAVLGVLLTVGYELLPASTAAEKVYIVLACCALSVATASAIGAWRSVRRFTLTSACMCVAVVCLAALSITAQDQGTSDSVSQSAPSSGSVSLAPGAMLLSEMTPVNNYGGYTSGPQTVNERTYEQSLNIQWANGAGCGGPPSYVTYQLGGKYRTFQATVGLADTSPSGDTDTFSVVVDGQQKEQSQPLAVRQTVHFTVSVSGAFRITLQNSCTTSDISAGPITAVWINPTVSP